MGLHYFYGNYFVEIIMPILIIVGLLAGYGLLLFAMYTDLKSPKS